jgi:serine/threonine protein kinase
MSETISPTRRSVITRLSLRLAPAAWARFGALVTKDLIADVAYKFLPANFAADADRLNRFEQEARATSALNHPNILTVYDIGSTDGSPSSWLNCSRAKSFVIVG